MGRTLPTVTHDDVNAAFADRSYLRDNRCITLNAVLTKRFVERSNRTTTFLAWVVVVLTSLAVLVGGAQLFFLLAGTSS